MPLTHSLLVLTIGFHFSRFEVPTFPIVQWSTGMMWVSWPLVEMSLFLGHLYVVRRPCSLMDSNYYGQQRLVAYIVEMGPYLAYQFS